MTQNLAALFFLRLAFVFALATSTAQQPMANPAGEDSIRAHYTKYEFRIPMRDGKRLFTAVYVPKDAAGGPYPFLMDRTPYDVAPYGEDQYPPHLGPLRSSKSRDISSCIRMCAGAG